VCPVGFSDAPTAKSIGSSTHALMTEINRTRTVLFDTQNRKFGPCLPSSHGVRLSVQVIAPFDSEDARGLLKASIRDPDPVVFLENEILYGESFPVSEAALDKEFVIPIGKAKVGPPR
jgi:Transketolase, pyrimidine binding domain